MANENLETTSPPPLAETLETGFACCNARDPETVATCALCQRPICKNCRAIVNKRQVCADCRAKIVSELDAEKAAPARLPPAVAGGIAAAILCGAAWATMVVVTNYEIGYAAVGVGFATGYGVLLGAGRKRGSQLQWVAVGCSVLGLIFGKYFIVAHAIVTHVEGAQGLSYFAPQLFRIFIEVLPKVLSPFDALWAFIALRIAWRIPKPTMIQVH
jgi:hypothetical protein